MFKVLLILYVVGGGSKGSYEYNTDFAFQEFHSMEDCELVRDEMKELKDTWHFNGDKKDIIPAHYSTTCVAMKTTGPASVYSGNAETGQDEVVIPPKPKIHKSHSRWDD